MMSISIPQNCCSFIEVHLLYQKQIWLCYAGLLLTATSASGVHLVRKNIGNYTVKKFFFTLIFKYKSFKLFNVFSTLTHQNKLFKIKFSVQSHANSYVFDKVANLYLFVRPHLYVFVQFALYKFIQKANS